MKIQRALLFTTLALALGLMHTTGSAAGVSVHFSDGRYVLAAGDVAGAPGFALPNYANGSTGASSLQDNNGMGTTVGFSVSSNFGIVNSPTAPSGPDETLNASLIGSSGPFTLTITGIPYASYSIVLYELTFTGVTQSTTLGATTFYGTPPSSPFGPGYVDGNSSTPFIYSQTVSTSSGSPTTGADYVVFSGLSGATQTITVTSLNASFATEVNGFQVVETVPEPSTWAMLACGLGALLGFHRLRRRSL